MRTMESEQFFLKWNNFENNLTSGFADLLQQEAMVDVTLAAEGKIIQAHKVILSICSSYFRNMFQLNPCQHPIVVLKDVGYRELTDMLDFMYKGEANVRQEDLPSFLKLAETLKVKGLAGSQTESENENAKKNSESQIPNLISNTLSVEKEVLSSDVVDEEIVLRKKRKRPISPYKNSTMKSFPYSQSIKTEVEECDDIYIENNIVKPEDNVNAKGERLSENSTYTNEYNSAGNEKDAGPSNLEESYEAAPQGNSLAGEYTFVESTRGALQLVFQGYRYRRRSWLSGKSYWFCHKEGCKSRGILESDGTFWLRPEKHNHRPNHEEIEKRKTFLKLKKLAIETKISGPDLLASLKLKKDSNKYLNLIKRWRIKSKRKQIGQAKSSASENGTLVYGMECSRTGMNEILTHCGYRYRRDSESGDNVYWRCVVKTCKGRAKTDKNGKLTLFNAEHSHPCEKFAPKNKNVVKKKKEDKNVPASKGASDEVSEKKTGSSTSVLPTVTLEGFSLDKLMTETLDMSF